MRFDRDGAQRVRKALSKPELSILRELALKYNDMGAGQRIARDRLLSKFLSNGSAMDKIAKSILGSDVRPVRAILFDKHPKSNWALGWHQDRTIAVRHKINVFGFGPWTKKHGINHVEPPFRYISRMITLRAHLDRCSNDNGPLLIIAGSHRLGRLPITKIPSVAQQGSKFVCLADEGDIWIIASSIIHASDAAEKPKHRRVLHVDYSVDHLPRGLEWYGIR